MLLRFFVDLDLVNQLTKLYMKIISTLEAKMSRLFKSNKQVFALPTAQPDAQFIYHAAPLIQHEQLRLNNLYKKYLKTTLFSKKRV